MSDTKRWDIVFIAVTSKGAVLLISCDGTLRKCVCCSNMAASHTGCTGPDLMLSRGFSEGSFSALASVPLEHFVHFLFFPFVSLSLHAASSFSTTARFYLCLMNFLSVKPTDAAIWEKLNPATVEPAVQEEREERVYVKAPQCLPRCFDILVSEEEKAFLLKYEHRFQNDFLLRQWCSNLTHLFITASFFL